jgi:hypothetical protein
MESWKDADAKNGGAEAQNGGLEDFVGQWSQNCITVMRSRIEMKSWIRIRIKVKSRIQIRIKVMRIRNPGQRCQNFQYFSQSLGIFY